MPALGREEVRAGCATCCGNNSLCRYSLGGPVPMCCNVMEVCPGAPRVPLQAASGELGTVSIPARRSQWLPTMGLPGGCVLTMKSANCPYLCLARWRLAPHQDASSVLEACAVSFWRLSGGTSSCTHTMEPFEVQPPSSTWGHGAPDHMSGPELWLRSCHCLAQLTCAPAWLGLLSAHVVPAGTSGASLNF